jgi:hypothetical protein
MGELCVSLLVIQFVFGKNRRIERLSNGFFHNIYNTWADIRISTVFGQAIECI